MNKDYFPIPDTSGMTPLTLDQYNALNGRLVIVEKNTGKKWLAIAQSISGDTCGYGRFWWAYAYPPAHIDREAAEARAKKAESERDEYFKHLQGLCFCCAHRTDGFDCHVKCYGHKRGSAWVYAGPRKEE